MPRLSPKSLSKLRFLLDENVPRKVRDALTDYDVVWVGHDLPTCSDIEIYKKAVASKRILITLDRDFVQLRIFQKNKPAIVLLRFNPQRPEIMARVVKDFALNFSNDLKDKLVILSASGALVYP